MSSTTAPGAAAPYAHWRLQIPGTRRRHLRLWFWSVAAMTMVVLVIGGITRLTQSGLSIVDWDPIMGVIPPLDDAGWQEAFDRYRQFPEYQQLRQDMDLAEFRFIYFWEYLHRLAARAIGLVFLVPFVLFWLRGYFNRPLLRRSLLLFGLGAAQGVMGWFMVSSGLVDRPSVSHFRLAAHLSLAFAIFGLSVWLALEMRVPATRWGVPPGLRRTLGRGLAAVGALLALQIVWGAFVAGLDAGLYHNTFPLMGGRLVPAGLLFFEPAVLNFVRNPVAVQWVHRVLGTALLLVAAGFALRVRLRGADPASLHLNRIFLGLLAGQYFLGVLTLVLAVPVSLGVLHQATALVLFGLWVAWVHHVRNLEEAPARATPGREVPAPAG